MRMQAIILGTIGTLMGFSATAQSLSVQDMLYQYNAVTTGDFESSQEVEGRVFVNGNLSGSNINIGFVPVPAGSDAVMVVNGKTTIGQINGQNGNVYLNDPGVVSSNIERGGNGDVAVYVNGGFNGRDNFGIVHANQGDLSSKEPQIDFGGVSSYSSYLSGLSGAAYDGTNFNALNNAVQSEGENWNASKVTVYNTSLAQLQSGTFQSNLGSGESMIVNVSGTSGAFGLNATGDMGVSGRILWNFYEATDIDVNTKILGSVLAPKAKMNGFNGSTEGSVFARAINLSNGELHLQPFVGDIPTLGATSVPEIGAEGAAGAVILVLGSLMVMSGRRRLAA